MAEISFRMVTNIGFDLMIVPLIIPYFLAVGANGQEPTQCFHLAEGVSEFGEYSVFVRIQGVG